MTEYVPTVPYNVSIPVDKIILSMEYIFGATECDVNVIFMNNDGRVLRTERVHIPPEIYSAWTTDDSTILNEVENQLGISIQNK